MRIEIRKTIVLPFLKDGAALQVFVKCNLIPFLNDDDSLLIEETP